MAKHGPSTSAPPDLAATASSRGAPAADIALLKEQLRAELRAELPADMKHELKVELARLFQVFAHLAVQSADADDVDSRAGKGRGLGFRPRKTRPQPPSASVDAIAQKQLRKLGRLP